ncbi:MAG TPA: hypothetical protein VMH34_02000 [Gammaproteobacteria bacterium]|nr:hypothetical protein [Gammaproteobacteria bacterium]
MISERERLQYQESIIFVNKKTIEIANQKNIRLRAPRWDDGTTKIVTGLHHLELMTNNASVTVKLKHEWLINHADYYDKVYKATS